MTVNILGLAYIGGIVATVILYGLIPYWAEQDLKKQIDEAIDDERD